VLAVYEVTHAIL